ncbi:LamG domain-containing protein [Streptomyces sp. ST2-7A]|uniref:LamG domain-containing protein n=1 Tax=Streptomyces sp. ST2-7A TaxID=2907214 RepID=UPI001F3B6D80|nr:LamG domain-containing protein [Streptomyces sp. ST2-7A]MCE7079207.1 LamG domain-containing protein [Streptomyces sp. ST2-7A]
MTLDGTDSYLRTNTRLPDPTADFTALAWVRLDETGDEPSVVWSLPGREHPDVELFHSRRLDRWVLGRSDIGQENSRPTGARARAPVSRTTNTWVHLVGTHDAARGELSLYVDGRPTPPGTPCPVPF